MSKKFALSLFLTAIVAIGLLAFLWPTTQNGPAKNNRPDKAQAPEGKGQRSISYSLSEKQYLSGNIKINYPQITGLPDSKLQTKINALLKAAALEACDYYAETEQSFHLEMDYQPKLVGAELLSIQYSGIGYVEGAAYPNNHFTTINLDLKRGSRLTLPELVKVDSSLVKVLQNGKLKPLKPEHDGILKNFTREELLDHLKRSDSRSGSEPASTFSYLTESSLGLSLTVPHALGDHAEFEIEYRAIPEQLLIAKP